MHKIKWLIVVFAMCGVSLSASSAVHDPAIKWYSIITPHFKVHFPEKNEASARKVAAYAEEAYDTVAAKFKWHPHGKTNIVVTDNYDDANGLTTVLPYKYINIRIASPDPDQSLQLYDNWLRTLVMHEYTHVVHMDQYGGVVTPLRYLFGSTISPNSATPGWIREGIATVQETETSTGGRGRAAYSDMIVRTAVLQKQFPKIDQVSGPGWQWPGAEGQYIFGVKFLQYLRDKYGEDKLIEFNERMSHSLMVYAVNIQAKRTWHKTFYQLWKEWQKELAPEYEAEAQRIRANGLTELTQVTKLGKDTNITAMAYSPDGKSLAYAMNSPHENPSIKMIDLETGKHRVVVKKLTANQLSFSPDGEKIYFSAASMHKRYNLFRDLYVVNINKDKLYKLTHGLRAQDPDVSPDGKFVVMTTSEDGTKQLVVYDVENKTVQPLPIAAPTYTHYSHPQWSPDGKMIAVSVWREGNRDIYIYYKDGKLFKTLSDDDAIDTDVMWSLDGKLLYFTSDRSGVSNIYAANIATGEIRCVSNVMTGAYVPTPIPGTNQLLVKYYTGKGYELMSFTPTDVKWSARVPSQRAKGDKKEKGVQTEIDKSDSGMTSANASQNALPEVDSLTLPKKKYTPFTPTLLLPHFISPFFTTLDNGILFGAMTGSSDPLGRHSWLAGAVYRTDSKHVGYSASYTYGRYRPQFTLSLMDYSVNLGNINFLESGVVVTKHLYEQRRRGAFTVAYPFLHQSVALMYSFEHRASISQPALTSAEDTALNFGRFAGVSLAYMYSNVESTKAAISTERGRKLRALLTFNDKIFGTISDNVQRMFQGDLRQYIPMPWKHHVLALRTAGGIAFGQQLAQGTYTLGGVLGEGALSAGGDSLYYFPLRGLPVASLSKSRALIASGEYRFPLIYAQHGLGTIPLFLNDLHAVLFADFGNAWNAHDSLGGYWGFGNFMLGTGAEIHADMVIGHGLPVTGRIGYGVIVVNRDRLAGLSDSVWGTPAKNGVFILQLGTSF